MSYRTLYRYCPPEVLAARVPDDPNIRGNLLLAEDGKRNCPGVHHCGEWNHDAHVVPQEQMLTKRGTRLPRCHGCNHRCARHRYHAVIKKNPALLEKQRSANARYLAEVRTPRMRVAAREVIDRLDVWTRDGGICGICGEDADPANWHLDHVIPISRGGLHVWGNVRVTHPACNWSKGARLDGELANAPVV